MNEIRVGVEADNRVTAAHLLDLYEQIDRAVTAGKAIRFVPAQKGRFFCSGFDLGDMIDRDTAEVADTFTLFLQLTRRVFHAPVPVSVVADGHAIGVGAMLCLAADACSMHEKGKFRFPEAMLGLGLFADVVSLISYRSSPQTVERLIRTGAALSAAQAHDHGLITSVHADGDKVGDLTASFAEDIPAYAFTEMKRLCRESYLSSDVASQVDAFMRLWTADETQRRMRGLLAAS